MKGVTVGGDDQEKNELIKNFSKNTPEIIQLYNYTYVLAENGQYIDLTGDGNTYQAVAYWSGKMDDNIVAQEGKNRATEFVATQMGQQKESSYITNSKKYKEKRTPSRPPSFSLIDLLVLPLLIFLISIV